MIDWNGNGKIDPIDIGISISTEKNNETQNSHKSPSGTGCLTTCLIGIFIIIFAAILIF